MVKGGDLIYGLHAVTEALKQNSAAVTEVVLAPTRHDARIVSIKALAEAAGIQVRSAEAQELDERSGGARHQGAIAVIQRRTEWGEPDLLRLVAEAAPPPLILALDQVQDPHNLGACLRSADAAGAHAVIVPKHKAAAVTPVVRKVACGAAEHVPVIQVTNLVRSLERLKEAGLWVYGADAAAEQTLYEADFRGGVVLVLGGEGKGLRRLTREHCDVLVALPMRGAVESLNVSVATGVLLYEVLRQRLAAAGA